MYLKFNMVGLIFKNLTTSAMWKFIFLDRKSEPVVTFPSGGFLPASSDALTFNWTTAAASNFKIYSIHS